MGKNRLLILITSVLPVLILSIIAHPIYSQNKTENVSVTVIDTVDDEEDLFDENTNYKEMYKDLNKDGEWIQMKESDLDDDSGESDGQEVTSNVTNIRIINVWRPRGMSQDWSPYSEGRWVYTYNGWIWASDYDWGWAAYHYGRWFYDIIYGWVWLPGRYWAPCWVQWSYTSSCIGWYPIYPRRHGWHHRGRHGRHDRFYHNTRHHHWVVVKRNKFTERIDKKVILDPAENKNILNGSKTIAVVKYDGTSFTNVGPKVNVIEKNTGQKIQPKEINMNGSKGKTKVEDNNVTIYRNDISKKDKELQKNKVDVTKTNGNKNYNPENGNKNKNTETNNENSKEKVTKNRDENTNKNKETNSNKESNKNRETYKNNESNKQKSSETRKESTNRETKTKKESKTNYEGSKDNNRRESNTNRDSGTKSRDSNSGSRNKESSRNTETSRSKGNTESKTSKK